MKRLLILFLLSGCVYQKPMLTIEATDAYQALQIRCDYNRMLAMAEKVPHKEFTPLKLTVKNLKAGESRLFRIKGRYEIVCQNQRQAWNHELLHYFLRFISEEGVPIAPETTWREEFSASILSVEIAGLDSATVRKNIGVKK